MKKNQTGFSLIELLLVIVVFGIVAYALTGFMFSRMNAAERLADSKGASDTMENALNVLTAIPFRDLRVGGSFTPVDEGTIQPSVCTPQTCDFVLDPEGGAADSMAGGVAWQTNPVLPAGARVAYLRRWLIEDVDRDLRLRRITVAVLADDQSTHPLSMIDTVVGER